MAPAQVVDDVDGVLFPQGTSFNTLSPLSLALLTSLPVDMENQDLDEDGAQRLINEGNFQSIYPSRYLSGS